MTPRRPHPRLSALAVPPPLGPALVRPALGAAFAAATLLALSGCGAVDAGAVSHGAEPSSPATSSAPASPAEPGATEEAPSEATSEPTSEPTEATSAEATPTETSEPVEPAQPVEPRMIAYAGGESPGAEIHNQADADKLQGAPAGFKRFIGRTAERLADGATCTDGYVGVTVEFLRTDGYAVGGVNECGGYRALWAVADGRWKEVAASQEMWDCAVLERYTVPSEIAGDRCYDYDAQKERRYQQA